MKQLILFLIPISILAQTTFISPIEYASQLYKNPRGIGCQHCHGDNGEGKLVATYIHKKQKRKFEGSRINNLEFKKFYIALNTRKKGMPRYFLTKKEIQALYLFLHQEKTDAK